MRASDTDRDEVVERLRRAGGEGRLEPHELDERVRRALVALTYGELSVLVADLPEHDLARRAFTPQRRVASWTWQTARTHPGAIVLLIPLVACVGALLFAMAVVTTVFVVIAALLGAQVRPGRRSRHTAASIS
jgi:hypothetical protein